MDNHIFPKNKKSQPNKEDYTFFKQYNNLCKITQDGLIIKYPNMLHPLPPLPVIIAQDISLNDFEYIGFQNTRENDNLEAKQKTVGFFRHDHKFEHLCYQPYGFIDKLRQYKQIMSPDLSCFTDMPISNQYHNIFLSRLIGAYWQNCGLRVLPTITWSTEESFSFCFSGIEQGAVVAVSTIGTGSNKWKFMAGFERLCCALKPSCVICYCNPYPEMHKHTKIIKVEHEANKALRFAKQRQIPGQLSFKI